MSQAESLLALIADLNAQIRALQAENADLRESTRDNAQPSAQSFHAKSH